MSDRSSIRVVVCAVAGLFAVSWILLPCFGAIDLAVTWSSSWPQVLEAGWGLFATVIVGAPFVLLAVRPRRFRPVALQLAVATVALTVSALASEEGRLPWFAAALALETAIVSWLSWRLRRAGPDSGRWIDPSRPLLVLAAAGAVPWLVYALDMWARNREGRVDAYITMGIDHYSMQGALALSLVLLSFLAAVRSDVRPFTPLCVAVAAFYLALVSVAWPDAAGGLTEAWSLATAAWALALLAAVSAQPLGALPKETLAAALASAIAGVFWLGVWWHQRLAHGDTSANEENLILGLTWMDSGKLVLLPLALLFVAIAALYRSTPQVDRLVTVAFAATAISLVALMTGTVLQFWRFEWGSYEQRFEEAAIGVGGSLQAMAAVALAVVSTALGIALARRRVLSAWVVPALPISALATFWLTPTSPVPGVIWIVLGGLVVARQGPAEGSDPSRPMPGSTGQVVP